LEQLDIGLDDLSSLTCQRCDQADEMLANVMTECPILQDACSIHFDEHNPITFLFDESIVALNFMRDAGLFEASRL